MVLSCAILSCLSMPYSIPKRHAQHSSTKKMENVLVKIAESLHYKAQLDMLLVEHVDPQEQENLFRLLSVKLQRNLLANMHQHQECLVIKFNDNCVWIKPSVWLHYLGKYYKQAHKESFTPNGTDRQIGALDYYFDPRKCKVGKQSWSRNRISQIWQGIICVIENFMHHVDFANMQLLFTNIDRIKWIMLIGKALSNKYTVDLSEECTNTIKRDYLINKKTLDAQFDDINVAIITVRLHVGNRTLSFRRLSNVWYDFLCFAT